MRTSHFLCLALAVLLGTPRSDANGPRLDGNGDPLPEQAVARFGTVRFAHTKYVLAVAFSPDGKILAGISPNEIVLWETSTGKPLHRLPGPLYDGWSLDFSPDGKTLATLGHGSVFLWDATTGGRLDIVTPVKSPRIVRYSPDGKRLAVSGDDGALAAWDVAGKKVACRFEGHTGEVWWADWSPDGKRLASCAEDGTVRLWDAATGKDIGRFYKKGEQTVRVRTAVFSPDGRTLAGALSWEDLLVWDVETGKELPAGRAVPRQRYAYRDVAASRDGTLWARGTHDRRVEVYRVKDRELLSPPEDRYVAAGAVALSPDGKTLLTEEGKQVRLWGVQGRKVLHTIEGQFGNSWRYASAAAFRPGGKTAVILGHPHQLHEIDVRTGKKVADPYYFDGGSTSPPYHYAMSPDGSKLAQSYSHTTHVRLTLLETAKGRQLKHWEDVGGSWIMAISPDGKVLAEMHDGNQTAAQRLVFRDLKTGKQLRVVELPYEEKASRDLSCLAYSPDGRTLAAGSEWGPIHFLDVKTGEEKGRLEGHRGPVKSVSFSGDGKTLASASADSTALIWDVTRVGKGKDK